MDRIAGDTGLERFVVVGSSGACMYIGHEAVQQSDGRGEVLGYLDETPGIGDVAADGLPIVDFAGLDSFAEAPVLVPVQSPQGRRSLFERLDAAGRTLLGMRGRSEWVHPLVDIDEGVLISSSTRVLPGVRLGRGVMAMGDLVSEDVEVGDFTTLAMHTIVLGHVRIGSGVQMAPGAIINNGTASRPMTIGDGAVIGTGAVVDRPVGPGEVVVGNRGMSPIEWGRLRRLARRA